MIRQLYDCGLSYGWISIALHWVGAGLASITWILGFSTSLATTNYLHAVALHTSFAVTAYLALWTRIAWRLVHAHPGPLRQQRGLSFQLGKLLHYGLLAIMAVMLISGPAMVWFGGEPIHVFHLQLPSPIKPSPQIRVHLYRLHVLGGMAFFWGVLIHVLAVCKRLIFDRDGTLSKIMTPSVSKD